MEARGFNSTSDEFILHLIAFAILFKVRMKCCFFLFPNLKEQQKSGRSPFTVS